MSLRHALVCLLLPAVLSAQTDVVKRLPADALFVVQIDGPAKWRERFKDTRVGKLVTRLVTPHLAKLDDLLEEQGKASGIDLKHMVETVQDYGGRITVAFAVDAEKLADGGDAPPIELVVLASRDGKTDLAKIAEQLRQLAEKDEGNKLADLKVQDRVLRVATASGEPRITLPFMLGDDLALVMSHDLSASVNRVLDAKGNGPALSDAMRGASFALHLDGQRLNELIGAALGMLGGGSELMQEVMQKLFGLDHLKAFETTVGAQGEHLVVDANFEFTGSAGIFDIYRPTKAGEAPLLDLVPRHAELWSVSPLRLDLLYRLLSDVVGMVETEIGQSVEDLERTFAEEFKVRLKEDLIDNLGQAILSVSDLADVSVDDEEESPLAALEGTCYGVALKDPAAFGAAFEKLLRSKGFHAGRKIEDYQGVKVNKISVLHMIEIEYAITDRLLLVAAGEAAGKKLRELIAVELSRKAGQTPGSFPPSVAARLALLPKGAEVLSAVRINSLFDVFTKIMDTAPDVDMEGVREVMKQIEAAVKDLDLEVMTSGGAYSERGLRIRVVW